MLDVPNVQQCVGLWGGRLTNFPLADAPALAAVDGRGGDSLLIRNAFAIVTEIEANVGVVDN